MRGVLSMETTEGPRFQWWCSNGHGLGRWYGAPVATEAEAAEQLARHRAICDDPADDGIRRIDIKEFREAGYLQEVNRRFLHPLGLALEVVVEEDGTERLGGVWDYRDDPEGMAFTSSPDPAYATRIGEEWSARASARHRALGFMVQPPACVVPELVIHLAYLGAGWGDIGLPWGKWAALIPSAPGGPRFSPDARGFGDTPFQAIRAAIAQCIPAERGLTWLPGGAENP